MDGDYKYQRQCLNYEGIKIAGHYDIAGGLRLGNAIGQGLGLVLVIN